MAYDFVQFLAQLGTLTLISPYLSLQMMPLAFLLLQFFFNGLLFFFDAFVLFDQAINLRFELLNIIESHGTLRYKSSCWSLVLSQPLVKLHP